VGFGGDDGIKSRPDTTRPAVEKVQVLENERLAPGIGRLVLHAPHTARVVSAGQFVHLRIARETDFILRRPFSVHRAVGERLELIYQVLGRGTRLLASTERGVEMDLIGPLGTGWSVPAGCDHALLVGGGLGAAPLGMLAEGLASSGVAVTVALGAPTRERLVAHELFERVARRVEVSTDDGSAGERGFVTLLTERLLASGDFDAAFVCGPEIMSRTVTSQALAHGVACQVSLERYMACGIGACLSCVCSTTRGRLRACLEGPVFDAEEVLWDESETPHGH
jgi:dihydroorotate dehydrogenase electron transfer subunit